MSEQVYPGKAVTEAASSLDIETPGKISARAAELQQRLRDQLGRENVNIRALQSTVPAMVQELRALHDGGSAKGGQAARETNAVRVAAHDMAIEINAWLTRTSENALENGQEPPGAAHELLAEMAGQLTDIYRIESTTFPETEFLNFPFTDVDAMLAAAGHALEVAQSGGYDGLDHDRGEQLKGQLGAMMSSLREKAADKDSDVQKKVNGLLRSISLQDSMSKN